MKAAPPSLPRSRSAAWAAPRRSPPPCCGCALRKPRSRSVTRWSSTAARPPERGPNAMTEPSWTTNELDRIGNADELYVAPRGKDGALRRAVPIWAVRVGDELYVRSWRGNGGRWYRAARVSGEGHITAGGVSHDVALRDADDGVNDAVDAAFREKYGRYTGLRRADGRAA